MDGAEPVAVAAPAGPGRPTGAWRSWREDASLLLAARIMGAGEHSSLQRLLLEPAGQPSGGTGREGGDVALRLLGALQLLLSGVEHAPHLLLAVQPLLTFTPPPAPSPAAAAASPPRCCRLCCALRLVCLLLGESVHCRRASLQPHLSPPRHATTSSGAPPAGEEEDAVAGLLSEVRDRQPRQRRPHATEAAGVPAVQPARRVGCGSTRWRR